MAFTPTSLALLGALAAAVAAGWALLSGAREPGAKCWNLLFIDDNAQMQRTTAVLEAEQPYERRLVFLCGTDQQIKVIHVSRIIEARDVPTGRRVSITRWVARHSTGPGTPASRLQRAY